jgi:hypothetical protein
MLGLRDTCWDQLGLLLLQFFFVAKFWDRGIFPFELSGLESLGILCGERIRGFVWCLD